MLTTIDNFSGSYEYLSNFATGYPFIYLGKEWSTSEHAYQAMKSKDPAEREAIRLCATPSQAKRMGRKVAHYDPEWDRVKGVIMYRILKQKFGQNPKIMKKLVATGQLQLIEGNMWHDNIWGRCKCPSCKKIDGKNMLGNVLMRLRKNIIEGNHE